jgi:hypothetical protein
MADIRLLLTDKTITQLPTPKDGWYLARDTALRGFFVVIGKRKRTFTVQGDLRRDGRRASSVRVSIGDTSEMSIRSARAIAKEYLAQISQGKHAAHFQAEGGQEAGIRYSTVAGDDSVPRSRDSLRQENVSISSARMDIPR